MPGKVHGEERRRKLALRDKALEERRAARLRNSPKRHSNQAVVRQSLHTVRPRADRAKRLARDGHPSDRHGVRDESSRDVARALARSVMSATPSKKRKRRCEGTRTRVTCVCDREALARRAVRRTMRGREVAAAAGAAAAG